MKRTFSNKKLITISIVFFGFLLSFVIIYMWKNDFTISETGTLGDGFNGLLAPFISFAGALLVYLSFREQIEANRIITSQWTFDLHLRIFEGIKADFNKIKVRVNGTKGWETIEGNDALIAIYSAWDDTQRVPEALAEFEIVTKELIFLFEKLEKTQIENKDYLLHKIILFYNNYYDETINEYNKLFLEKPTHVYQPLLKALDDLKAKIDDLRKSV